MNKKTVTKIQNFQINLKMYEKNIQKARLNDMKCNKNTFDIKTIANRSFIDFGSRLLIIFQKHSNSSSLKSLCLKNRLVLKFNRYKVDIANEYMLKRF